MPKNIYRLKDGTEVPGVTTLVKLADDAGGLIGAAAKIGPAYREVWNRETDIGTAVHDMIVQRLEGRPITNPLEDPDLLTRAYLGYRAAEAWLITSKINPIEWEVSLVSEEHRFGGQIDMIGRLKDSNEERACGDLVVVDWKTSKSFYSNMLTQVAAYRELWNENRPGNPITGGAYVVRLGKDDGATYPRHYPPWKLDKGWEYFLLMRRVWGAQKELNEVFKERSARDA